jgi:hypothetical protein
LGGVRSEVTSCNCTNEPPTLPHGNVQLLQEQQECVRHLRCLVNYQAAICCSVRTLACSRIWDVTGSLMLMCAGHCEMTESSWLGTLALATICVQQQRQKESGRQPRRLAWCAAIDKVQSCVQPSIQEKKSVYTYKCMHLYLCGVFIMAHCIDTHVLVDA